MNALRFVWFYVHWHYTTALIDLFGIFRNALWGIGHVFSVPELLRTLFVPWHRLSEKGATLFQNPAEFLGNLVLNLILRILGFCVRSVLLSLALALVLIAFVLFIGVTVAWVVLPVALVVLVVGAFNQLFA